MAYEVRRSAESDRDLDLIFDHLVNSYLSFGDSIVEAFSRATARVRRIEADMDALAHAPYQGTLWPEVATGLRHVTKNRAIFYFDVDDERQLVRVLAIFFGGQDHQRLMLVRLGTGR
ncbi:type II toxin-antitoxin system RelE/ParE family toxin [Ciceribacter sp. RN22]|uniref:type II toxin-antitoxin system RelE/ParE family toxin n=1 Tax=Ciceribacter sp. RN22 TaxID=2954932 RepID=UPI0020930840|nr:type II toxin-antitoxin system RelE/ParE family toxin [Ciceribacter sp. RN22]MCO6180125.1 type II toxin-antitoxin system RelE/ParE family toxin [Ciceribacter sp. RN22]